jgi:hypothetical protein
MAFDLDQLNAVTRDYYKNQTTDIYFRENVLLYALMGSGKMDLHLISGKDLVDGGTKIREFLEYGRSNVGTYGNTSTITTTKVDIVNAARFDWSGYAASNAIDLDEQTQNSGAEAMVDLAYTKLQNIQKSIRDYMGAGIYIARASSPDTYGFAGLPDLFNTDSSVAYGTIAEDDMADWKPNVDTTAEAISYKVMQRLFRLASIGQTREAKPNLIITTQLLKDGYTRTLQAQQRFQDNKMAEAGFQNILHDGVPMVYDDNQATGVVDCLNTKYLKIKTHGKYNFTVPKWVADEVESPDNMVANTRWRGALVCSNRKAHSRGSGKTEPA